MAQGMHIRMVCVCMNGRDGARHARTHGYACMNARAGLGSRRVPVRRWCAASWQSTEHGCVCTPVFSYLTLPSLLRSPPSFLSPSSNVIGMASRSLHVPCSVGFKGCCVVLLRQSCRRALHCASMASKRRSIGRLCGPCCMAASSRGSACSARCPHTRSAQWHAGCP
eukprot:359025-Chlamydomonas_euryale.AAC.3